MSLNLSNIKRNLLAGIEIEVVIQGFLTEKCVYSSHYNQVADFSGPVTELACGFPEVKELKSKQFSQP